MEKRKWSFKKILLLLVTYVIVGCFASAMTLMFIVPSMLSPESRKLQEVLDAIDEKYIGDADQKMLTDTAAAAIVAATGDPWSYYIPADMMSDYENSHANAYVGIGVTIQNMQDGSGFRVERLEPNGPAIKAGLMPGDVIVGVNGENIKEIGVNAASEKIRGEEGTKVKISVLRGEETLEFEITRERIESQVVSGSMIADNVGYIKINNFNDRCSDEFIAQYEKLEKEGAKAFVFDVRGNPGGYVHELVAVLDYLLPEGVLFRSEDYQGIVSEETSDADCKKAPMTVLMNGDSYSAAEFFAAALTEYDYGVTVGDPTTGKGRFQQTIYLSDGSAINLSVGKYTTPNGVDLSEVGGLKPAIPVEITEEKLNAFYSGLLTPEEDPQLQAALKAVQEKLP